MRPAYTAMSFWCRRICSWGPLVALTLISVSIISSSYSAIQICGLNGMKAFKLMNFLIIYPESFWVLYVYFSAMSGPGFAPSGWSPGKKDHLQHLQYCDVCKGYKPPRSHHCKSCGHCVLKMDHHCVWINTCVGHDNHTTFIAFLFFLFTGSIHAVAVNCYFLYKLFDRAFLKIPRTLPINTYTLFLVISGIAFAIGAGLGVLILLIVQMKGVLKNKTQIEEWICDKARDRRKRNNELQPFDYPYDLGRKKNFSQVVRCSLSPVGDGYSWPVKNGSDQYAFTIEQIEQKKEKASFAITCNIIKSFNGKRFSLSNGIKVLCSMPLLESPMVVKAGQPIVITRWGRNWVYGSVTKGKSEKKGWIPRSCIQLPSKKTENVSKNDTSQPRQRSKNKI